MQSLSKYKTYPTIALATRLENGSASLLEIFFPAPCDMNAITLKRAAMASRGTFSSKIRFVDSAEIVCSSSIRHNLHRRSGQTSSSNRMQGKLTSIGFAISPSTNRLATSRYFLIEGAHAYLEYARSASKP